MEEVRQLVQEEGREARNLVAFHVAVDTSGPPRVARKPPRSVVAPRRAPPRPARLRSASAGRDKRSELRARYWALLFGDLQRAIGEIYNTVEAHENLNECQEVILVLENYTRDFKALGEWFRLKWEYDNTPPPQRPQSLAWEIRKTDFVRPESRRTYSVKSSPSVSGKNSPCLSGHNTPSGKNSPNLTGKASPGSGKISPRVSSGHSSTSPKANIEFFSNKISSKITTKPEPKAPKEASRLFDIKEKDVKDTSENNDNVKNSIETQELSKEKGDQQKPSIEIGKARECPNVIPKQVVIKSPKHLNSTLEGLKTASKEEQSNYAKSTTEKLDAMESEFLKRQLANNSAKNDNILNQDKVADMSIENTQSHISEKLNDKKIKQVVSVVESPSKSEDNFGDVSNESSSKSNDETSEQVAVKLNAEISVETSTADISTSATESAVYTSEDTDVAEEEINKNPESMDTKVKNPIDKEKSEQSLKFAGDSKEDLKRELDSKKNDAKSNLESKSNTRPAYSQAAAKPKLVTTKTEVKPVRSTTPLTRSKTVVEIRPNTASKTQNQFLKRNQASKCSYPFNLTTGRTSLFDTTSSTVNKGAVSKRPINRSVHTAAGDSKLSQTKSDLKKRLPRPTSLKINEKSDKEKKANSTFEKIKDYEEYSSSDTIVTQIDMSRIESSESLKTLVSDDSQIHDANSIEVLNVDNNKNDNEGWLTVKSRRLSRESKKLKSHWANRYHQPSATTSLPTLNMMESPKQESKPIVDSPKTAKSDRAKSEQPRIENSDKAVEKTTEEILKKIPEKISGKTVDRGADKTPEKKSEKTPEKRTHETDKSDEKTHHKTPDKTDKATKVSGKSKSESKSRDLAIIRQKSDVTGLKTRSARSKALTKKAEKVTDPEEDDEGSELIKNRLHLSLESLTTGLARSQESTDEPFDFDKWKAEFKTTFKFLEEDDQIPNHSEILKTADPSEMSEIAEMTSQIEENEKKLSWALDFQSEVDQRKLCEEEDLLNRQIRELELVTDMDLDTETDDTETDAEIPCEYNTDERPSCSSPENLGSLAASLEDQYETALAGMSWAERVDTLVILEDLVARDPGRAQQLHEKLSQGLKRRGSFQDALRRLQQKQARAEKKRKQFQSERSNKIHQLLARVEEVKMAKNQLIEEKRMRMERRLQKAAENRDQHLKDIVRKAHDEEEKLREIAFIKQLEAENRRHEFLDQCRSHTTRLRQMRRDRLIKLEQKAAREAAVGARRQALEAARKLHVETLLERRKERDARLEELKEQKKQERDDAAREKAEGVKSRLSALAAAAEQEADALRSRIRDKQDASQQRLESRLQAIRERATGPRLPTMSESQDQNAKEIDEEAERLEQEKKEKEKQKTIKKKARKIKQKLLSSSVTLQSIPESSVLISIVHPSLNKLAKVIHQLNDIILPLLVTETKSTAETNQELSNNDQNKSNHNDNKVINGDLDSNTCNGESKKKTKKNKRTNNEQADKNTVNNTAPNNDTNMENNNNNMPVINVQVNSNGNESKNENHNKKRNKKNKNRENDNNNERNKNVNDKPKLSKASSVCSSTSDMSKASGKAERKSRVVIDTPFLERQLNELHRIIDKMDKTAPDLAMYQKTQCLRVIGNLLAVAAEREDMVSQFSTKSLTTATTVVCRVVAACGRCAELALAGSLCVHAVRLLSAHLEKDLQSDQKETELAKQLSDCLSLCLDSVLCATRIYEESGKSHMSRETLATLRSRAHTLISYLCLCGCITRAENAGKARESIQTLLTVCAGLCHPCDLDTGPERVSATQSLRSALGTGLCGSRAEFCVLFARGADLTHCGGFVRAARTSHLLRCLAELDHQIVQEAFGEGGWPLEFRAAVARLLSQHAPNDREAPRDTALHASHQRLDQTLSESMVLDLIVLVGFVVVNNPQLHETICDGWSVIKTLCTLPANWLVSPTHSHALLPTLIAFAERPETAAAIASELSMKMLEEYLDNPEVQKLKLIQVIKQGKAKKHTGKT